MSLLAHFPTHSQKLNALILNRFCILQYMALEMIGISAAQGSARTGDPNAIDRPAVETFRHHGVEN
jgi:hypothetical protein